jgi:hypothetical protein
MSVSGRISDRTAAYTGYRFFVSMIKRSTWPRFHVFTVLLPIRLHTDFRGLELMHHVKHSRSRHLDHLRT